MFGNLTVSELVGLIVGLSGLATAVVFLTKPVRRIYNDVNRLKAAVFDAEGKSIALATKDDISDLTQSVRELTNAANLMYKALVAVMESQPDNTALNEIKNQLHSHKWIV